MRIKVLIAGGGSGGHIYPALAVAAQLVQQYQAEILYLGSDDGLEMVEAPKAGFPFVMVKAGRLRRYLSWQTLTDLARVPLGLAQAIGIVRRFRPHVAFTSGGYVAVPAGLAARLNGVPLLMHQQDVPPNLSNKLIAPLATRVTVAFSDSLRYFPARKTRQMGNPLRQLMLDIRSVSSQQARRNLGYEAQVPLLLVTGGSQGARQLNQALCSALPRLLPHCQILHISGKQLYAETQTLSSSAITGLDAETRGRYRLVPYLEAEMPAAVQAATLVICRAGASTLSELALLGKPSLLVPLPPAIGSSPQEANAAMFARAQAAIVIRNADLKQEVLVDRVINTLSSENTLIAMSEAARALAMPEATQNIAAAVATLAQARSADALSTIM